MAKGSYKPSRLLILSALGDHRPKSCRQVVEATGLTRSSVYNALYLCWKQGLVLRTEKPLYQRERIFKGRGGVTQNTRPYHLYLLRPVGRDSVDIGGRRFVGYAEEHLDPRGGGKLSKARKILSYIREHGDRAFFSKEIAEALRDKGVKVRDVMSNVRRFEEKGLVYVRGYKTDERQTPFKEGYLITWLNPEMPRKQAIKEAVERTNRALKGRISSSPLMERVHRVPDMIIEHTQLRKLVSYTYLENKLGCTPYQAERAMRRALQLYPDLRELKLFGAYRYYHHASLAEEDLQAALEMKRNYIRLAKGRANRIGHNWEAVAEWFIDRFTIGARFWTQNHRTRGMDPRRITLHLLRGVGGRRNSAEVDRVWEVTPGVFAPPITYVLSCKWGLVSKRDVDDFLDVLMWSKEFGVDTPDGRDLKQGVVGVFAASAFNPRENVQLKDGTTISLAQYTARRKLQLLKASDFNQKLRDKGCPKMVSVQKVCKRSRDEGEVRETLDRIWKQPEKGEEILNELLERNRDLYHFEKMLETGGEKPK
jgi:DNA-binding MarR family transcriptional regulator